MISNGKLIRIHNSHQQSIHSVDDWFKLAPPKKPAIQWQDGHSAKESAKAWFRSGYAAVPVEIQKLLDTHTQTTGFQGEWAIPELETKLYSTREGRNNDVLAFGYAGAVPTVLAVEAKADELFSQKKVGPYLKSITNPKSHIPFRIASLSTSLFGRAVDADISELRYQLLHSIAAALIEAKHLKAMQAVFIVHEFLSSKLKRRQVAQNHHDLRQFVRVLTNSREFELETGTLYGPLVVPGSTLVPSDIPVFIGKVSVNLDIRTARCLV